MKFSRKKLNDVCWQIVSHYDDLNVGKVKVKTPYYINNLQMYVFPLMKKAEIEPSSVKKFYELYKNNQAPYGWYRGKGTPQELERAVIKISKKVGFDLESLSPNLIREFMKLYGIGIDCSGFVYNVLDLGLKKARFKSGLAGALNWPKDQKNDAYHIGVESFYLISRKVKTKALQALDLVITLNDKKLDHLALILEKRSELFVCQSTMGLPETGISVTRLYNDRLLGFEYKPEGKFNWEDLLKTKQLEFRRLFF